jgi:hypothetical protein
MGQQGTGPSSELKLNLKRPKVAMNLRNYEKQDYTSHTTFVN